MRLLNRWNTTDDEAYRVHGLEARVTVKNMTTTTEATPPLPSTFAYAAQTFDGQPISGTIDAVNLDEASKRLANLRLRVIRLDPTASPPKPRPLRGDDFASFNQQLAQLAASGLPVEQGLRLIAEDLGHGGLAESIRQVSAELEQGVPLGEAFARHEKQFPSIYGTLVDAGVRSGNLSAVLLNLGRHVELINRLRAAVWQAAAYPIMVLISLLFILWFLAHSVFPEFHQIFGDFKTDLPGITKLLFAFGVAIPWIILIGVFVLIGWPLMWIALRAAHLNRAAADLALLIPLIGPVLKRNLIARWCDAMRLGVLGGMDLPGTIQLANDIVGSPALRRDGERIIQQLNEGKDLAHLPFRPRVIPITALAMLQMAADRNDLPA
jgi:type IV pilus assembly protein PilC